MNRVLDRRARWAVQLGDCLPWLRQLPDDCIDAVVTDPPYGIGTREPSADDLVAYLLGGSIDTGGDFMGKDWQIPPVAVWREIARVLKPGAHVLSFAGQRTVELIALGIRAGGLQRRDLILSWTFGEGIPKGTRMERVAPELDEYCGWASQLKPAQEPIVVARKAPVGTLAANVCTWGTGALNVAACRVGHASEADRAESEQKNRHEEFGSGPRPACASHGDRAQHDRDNYAAPAGRWPPNLLLGHAAGCARVGVREVKGLSTETGADCAGRETTRTRGAGLGGRSTTQQFESVPVYACAPGCPVAALDAQAGVRPGMSSGGKHREGYGGGMFGGIDCEHAARGDTGGPSRFYPQFELVGEDFWPFWYCAKAARAERERGCDHLPPNPKTGRRNDHVSVKPVALCRWLVRLVTPPGGIVLDPYAGSGSIGVACKHEALRYLGLELDPCAHAIATARLEHTDSPMLDWIQQLEDDSHSSG